jgi:hypothetical protein
MQFKFVLFNGRRTKISEIEEVHPSVELAQERAREIAQTVPEVKSVSLWFGLYLLGTHTAKKDMIFDGQISKVVNEHVMKQAESLLEEMKLG